MKSFKQFLQEVVTKPLEHGSYEAWENANDNAHLGKTEKEVSDKIHDLQGTRGEKNDKTNPTHKALNLYSKNSSVANRALFQNHIRGVQTSHIIPIGSGNKFHDLNALDKALDEHELKEPMTVYSGVSFNPRQKAQGLKMHLPAYTSTSISKKVAEGYSSYHAKTAHNGDVHKHILQIQLDKGQKGRYVGTDSKHRGNIDAPISDYVHEQEFILPRKSNLEIHPVPEKYETQHEDGTKTIHHIWHSKII